MELGRYFNSKDEPIVLTNNRQHARLTLTRGKKNLYKNEPTSEQFLQLELGKTDPCADVQGDKSFCLSLVNSGDMAYMAEIMVGNPPQKVRGLFDTGSANTWILNSDVYKKDGYAYNNTQSTTSLATT